MELFFLDTPIGILTGLIKKNSLYSLSKQVSLKKELGQEVFLSYSLSSPALKTLSLSNLGKKNLKKHNKKALFLKSLDKTYCIDFKRDPIVICHSLLVKKIKKELDLFFKGRLKSFSIPLYKKGTAFQQEVWQALQSIPYGQTKTYSEIAKLVKKPKAYRAVGTCLAKNPYLIITPCHRVVSKQGLGAFALGLRAKKQLLKLEKTYSHRI